MSPIELGKTWDEFVARQVQATLAGEDIHTTAFAGADECMAGNRGIRAPATGLVWRYAFGRAWPNTHDTEYWFVNLRQQQVVKVRYRCA